MLNELFAREILETSIALGILQEMNGGVVIYHEASKEDPENLPAGWYIDDKDYTTFSRNALDSQKLFHFFPESVV